MSYLRSIIFRDVPKLFVTRGCHISSLVYVQWRIVLFPFINMIHDLMSFVVIVLFASPLSWSKIRLVSMHLSGGCFQKTCKQRGAVKKVDAY